MGGLTHEHLRLGDGNTAFSVLSISYIKLVFTQSDGWKITQLEVQIQSYSWKLNLNTGNSVVPENEMLEITG